MSRFETVLLDLDGTVIDSVALIRESHRHAVRRVLGLELADEALVANVGRPLPEQMAHFSEEHVEPLLAAYQEWNEANTTRLLRAYDDLDTMLVHLRDAGVRLGIVTSKRARMVALAWDVLPLHGLFDVVITADDTRRHKPDPEPIAIALERLGAEAATAAFVGDAPFDIRAGNAAGVHTVGVTWGFFTRAQLELESPDDLVDTVAELEARILGG
jgi:pyrophosphatase PpaX